jgi:hypothetical protein
MLRQSVPVLLLCCASALAQAQEISGLGGALRDQDRAHTFTWLMDYQRSLGEYAAFSAGWINEGHVPGHHRDGAIAELWWRTTTFGQRLTLAAGVGPYAYFDTVPTTTGDVQPHSNQGASTRRCRRACGGFFCRCRGAVARGRDTRGQRAAATEELPARRVDRIVIQARRRRIRRNAGRCAEPDTPVQGLSSGKDIGSIYRCLNFLPDAAPSLLCLVPRGQALWGAAAAANREHGFDRAICVPLAT